MTWKGQLFFEDKPETEPPVLPGSLVAFSRNGELQGVAFRRVRALHGSRLLVGNIGGMCMHNNWQQLLMSTYVQIAGLDWRWLQSCAIADFTWRLYGPAVARCRA